MGQSTTSWNRWRPWWRLHYLELCPCLKKTKIPKPLFLIGEIGGNAEERATSYFSTHVTKVGCVIYCRGYRLHPTNRWGRAGPSYQRIWKCQKKIAALDCRYPCSSGTFDDSPTCWKLNLLKKSGKLVFFPGITKFDLSQNFAIS